MQVLSIGQGHTLIQKTDLSPQKDQYIAHFQSKTTYSLCNICCLCDFLKNIYSFYVDNLIGGEI